MNKGNYVYGRLLKSTDDLWLGIPDGTRQIILNPDGINECEGKRDLTDCSIAPYENGKMADVTYQFYGAFSAGVRLHSDEAKCCNHICIVGPPVNCCNHVGKRFKCVGYVASFPADGGA